jgi:hypothetical protein
MRPKENRVPLIAEVTGSNPVSPTISKVYIKEELPLRELLEVLFAPEGVLTPFSVLVKVRLIWLFGDILSSS